MNHTTTAYGPCPRCQSLNMANRRRCYHCGETLPTEFWIVCRQRTFGSLQSYQAQYHEARLYPRYDIRKSLEMGGTSFSDQTVSIRNISVGGLQFVAKSTCAPTERVWLYVPIREHHIHIIQGIIRYSVERRTGSGLIYVCGVQFLESLEQVSCLMPLFLGGRSVPKNPLGTFRGDLSLRAAG